MDAAAEIGRNPVYKHQIQPEYGDEQADAGRDCRTRLTRPNSQARTRTGQYSFSLFSWPHVGLATLPGRSILLLYVMTIHTYLVGSTAVVFIGLCILLICSTKVSTCTAESDIQLHFEWLQVQRTTKFSGADADRAIFIFPFQLTTCRIGNLTRLIHTIAICDDHTYIGSTAVVFIGLCILLIYSTKVSTCTAESDIQLHFEWLQVQRST